MEVALMAPVQKAVIFVSCSYSCIQRSHTFINGCFVSLGVWWAFTCFCFQFCRFKMLSSCNSASISDLNNAESLSTKFNGREGPRLSSLDLKILSFFFNCLTKWPTPAKPLSGNVGWVAIQICSRKKYRQSHLGKKKQKQKTFEWNLQKHQVD